MSDLRKITVGVGAEFKALDDQLKRAYTSVEDFARRAESKVGQVALKPGSEGPANATDPAASATGGADAIGSQIDKLASGLPAVVNQIRAGINQALQPLIQFAARFSAQFDQVGGAVLELSKRIDDHMRFPGFVQRVETLRGFIRKSFGLVKADMKSTADSASTLQPNFTGIITGVENLEKRVKRSVAPIPGDVGYALEAAHHKGAGGFDAFIRGLDELDAHSKLVMENIGARSLLATRRLSPGPARERNRNKAELEATQAAVGPVQDFTPATVLPPDRLAALRKSLKAAQSAATSSFGLIGKAAQGAAIVVDKSIGAYLKYEKVKSVIATFGSVAESSFAKIRAIKVPEFKFDMRQSTIINNMGTAAEKAGRSFRQMGTEIFAALGFFGLAYKAVDFIKTGIAGASDLNETLSKTDAVLGDASAAVKVFADDLSGKFGISKQETLDVASGIGGLGKSLGGLKGEELENFTKKFTKLSADLQSSANLSSMAEAGKALQIGLSGNQSDTLKSMGVVLTETTLKAYAAANGIGKLGKELTEEEKVTARAGLIFEGLSFAHNDLENTASGTANQFRKFTGTISNLGVSIGQALLPAVNAGLNLFNQFGQYAVEAFSSSEGAFARFSDAISTGFHYISAAVNHWQSALEVARLYVMQGLANVGEYFDVLGPNIATVAEYIANNWQSLLSDAFNWTIHAIENLWGNFQKIGQAIADFLADPTKGFQVDFASLSDGFEATAAKFPELLKPHLTDMSKEIAAAAQPILDEVAGKAERAQASAAAQKQAAEKAAAVDVKALKKAETEMETFAKKLKKDTQTPLEKYQAEVAKIDKALKGGKIDQKTADRARAGAAKDFIGDGPKLSAAAEAGSADARSALLRAMHGGQSGSKVEQATQTVAARVGQSNSLLTEIHRALIRQNAPEFNL
jgi:hypothetical protein